MKNFTFLFSILILVTACSQEVDTNCDDNDFICTRDLRNVSLTLVDENGNNILLDETKTTDSSGREVYSYKRTEKDPEFSWYVVLSDTQYDKAIFNGSKFKFRGWKDGKLVVKEKYKIGKDCCHIFKVDGTDKLILD